MRVVLINPPSLYLENDASYPPMGLLYIAGKCIELGHECAIHDFTVAHRPVPDADLYGITCVTPNVPVVARIVGMLPKETPVMIGGPHPTAMPLSVQGDMPRPVSVVVGECESGLKQILTDAEAGKMQPVYPCDLPCMAAIPEPARYLVDEHRYHPGGEERAVIHTSRGCPYHCAFCSKVQGNGSIRLFSPSRVKREIGTVQRNGFSRFLFGDDNAAFLFHKPHGKELLKEIGETGMTWRINQDVRHTRLFPEYAEAGCTDISFGIESGSDAMLDAMHKQATVRMNREAIRKAHEAGLKVRAYFMVNFPGETEETVRETIAFAEETRPDSWLLSAFAPLPGSPVWINLRKYGITEVSRNWQDYFLVGKNGGFRPCFETETLTHERQVELHDRMRDGLKDVIG